MLDGSSRCRPGAAQPVDAGRSLLTAKVPEEAS
jgi:hypothetical protein